MDDIYVLILFLMLYFSPVFYQLVIVIKESKRGNRLPLKRFLKILKISLFILIPIAVVFGVLSHTNFLDYEKPIPYERHEEITFENFRGLEFFKRSLYGNERFAYVITTFESKIEDDGVTVEAFFHPSRSFVYNKKANSPDLLTHEIYHFKITEAYVRRAKWQIDQMGSNDRDAIRRIIKLNQRDCQKYQQDYDYDSFHSYVLSEQKRYEKEVDSLLALWEDYKTPKVYFNE